jgi:hypothetical protein
MQELYDRLKGRKDVQVVTFNVDDNVGLVTPFMKQNKYTFPVVPAQFLVQQLAPSLAIPLSGSDTGAPASARVLPMCDTGAAARSARFRRGRRSCGLVFRRFFYLGPPL